MAAPEDQRHSSFLDEVDEEEDEIDKPKKQGFDWDRICAYKTFRVIRIKDRNLGLLYWTIVTLVIFYIIIFGFLIEAKHQYQEPGIGTVITRFQGKAFFENKVYDEADLRYPEVEPFGAFIMTKSITVKGQKLGTCIDYDNPCPCRGGGECVGDAFCKDRAWCPSIGDGNAADPPEGAITVKMKGLEHTKFEIMSGIAFPGIGNYFFVTGKSAGAVNPFKNITLEELLSRASPPVRVQDVLDTGALISISFFWNCDVSQECEPAVIVKRLDSGKGFVQKRVRHQHVGGVHTRDAIYMHGLRLLVESSGIGRRISLVLIVIQIGSGLALLRTASMAADFLMLRLYSKVRSQAYYTCKVIPTEDYSDLQDRINLIKDEKERMAREKDLDDAGQANDLSGAGARVALGLGPGGRGGMAAGIISGHGSGHGR